MSKPPIDLNPSKRLVRWRRVKDVAARYAIALGGLSVIAAVLLILLYLAWEVLPLFQAARIGEPEKSLSRLQAAPVYLEVDEQEEVSLVLAADGSGAFNRLETGALIDALILPIEGRTITAVGQSTAVPGLVALGLDDGRVLPIRIGYESRYPDGERVVVPSLEYPYGQQPISVGNTGSPITRVAYADDDARLTLVALSADGSVRVARFDKVVNFLSDEVELEREDGLLSISGASPRELALSANQRFLYVAMDTDTLAFVDITRAQQPMVVSQEPVGTGRITSLAMLLGGISLLIGDDQGQVSQHFPVRKQDGRYHLQQIRVFSGLDHSIAAILPEQRRKGFVAIDASGAVAIHHTTAHRLLVKTQAIDGVPLAAALSPRSSGLVLIDTKGQGHTWNLDNQHPEVSWAGLWTQVWYENYGQPEFIWQSSAANNDFEPKFSLTPLAFGTLKAALYAMLFAVPLALAAAVYTAYFMAPGMRRLVKPTIEIMAALPTVILGFLAGLWFAPFLEENLSSVLVALLVVPLGILAFAGVWQRLPGKLRHRLGDGWQSAVLIPVVIGLTWLGMALGQPLEQWLFGTELRIWLNNEMGVTYDQRNALVVGVAMGFAVIPTIFSIAEDAVFSVPQSLTQGSLALGATPWQSVVRVVLPTASPGIFSALMIGFGRAVGETMIVLMATGNTPIMDMNIFEGMRTLAANIAVEMPESEVGSTHFRVLYLAAFVLFVFTFVFNTGAEIIRQRLRDKYSNL